MTPEEFEAILRARGAATSERYVQEYLWYRGFYMYDLAYAKQLYSRGKSLEYELKQVLEAIRRVDKLKTRD